VKIRKLENGFTRLTCEYCGHQLIYHISENEKSNQQAMEWHEDTCDVNTNNKTCFTCKYGYLLFTSYRCSISGRMMLKTLSTPRCWVPRKPRVSVWQQIKQLLKLKGGSDA
jgi:hypothetical protein